MAQFNLISPQAQNPTLRLQATQDVPSSPLPDQTIMVTSSQNAPLLPSSPLFDLLDRRLTAAATTDKVLKRRGPRSSYGRLVSLSHHSQAIYDYLYGNEAIANAVVINFPSMPDTIDLQRQALYSVTPSFIIPDGIHQYKATDPLKIPFSFSLHAFDDDYCDHGSLSLLQIAARLHALVLPIGTETRSPVTATVRGELAFTQSTADPQQNLSAETPSIQLNDAKAPLYPVAVKLDLIYAGPTAPGISCVGYIDSVSVRLKGPWLSTPDPSHKNLPTAADYSFVFVHRPGYSNNLLDATSQQVRLNVGVNAFADDVKDRLYNTVGLLAGQGVTYKGFNT